MEGTSEKLIKQFFDYRGAPVLAVGVIFLFFLERKFALRKRKRPELERIKTNLAVAVTASVALRFALIPALVRLAFFVQSRKSGLLRILKVPPSLTSILGFLILDYGNYKWHRANHEVPWLWKMHQVHHADLDLDVTTALRFHFAEVLGSIVYRGGWISVAGVSPQVVLIYELLFEGSNNFQHSNLRLSEKMDRLLANLIVTPRMHGIHHSVVKEETDSNYSIVLTIWDRLHRTLKLDIPQTTIDTGLPYVKEHLDAKKLFLMPIEDYQTLKQNNFN